MTQTSVFKKLPAGILVAAGLLTAAFVLTPKDAAARERFSYSGSFNNWGGSSFSFGYSTGGHRSWNRGWSYSRRGHDHFSLGFTYVVPPPVYYAPSPYTRPYSRYPGYSSYSGYYPAGGIVVFSPYTRDRLGVGTRRVYYDAYRNALAAPIGESINWRDGRVEGDVTTTRDGWAGDRYCREFRQNIVIDGKTEMAYGTACRNAENTDWEIIPD